MIGEHDASMLLCILYRPEKGGFLFNAVKYQRRRDHSLRLGQGLG
jgi:hypothetical protein